MNCEASGWKPGVILCNECVSRRTADGLDAVPGSEPETKIREAATALCDALAERWFEPGDTEAQTACAVAAHKVLSDLLMEGGGE